MELSKFQKDLTKEIAAKEIIDLNTFYSRHIKSIEENISIDILKYENLEADLPHFCSLANTKGIILDHANTDDVIKFIELWEKLERNKLITTIELSISPFKNEIECLIPLDEEGKRDSGKYNNPAYRMSKDYLHKQIHVNEELFVFIKNRFLTYEERKDTQTRKIAKWALCISICSVIISVFLKILF